MAPLIHDIQEMRTLVPGLAFVKEHREANAVAHELARLSRDGLANDQILGMSKSA